MYRAIYQIPLLIILIFSASSWGEKSKTPRASVTMMVGKVEYKQSQEKKWRRLRIGKKLHQGAWVRTGWESQVDLNLNKAKIEIKENSTVILSRIFQHKSLSSTSVELSRGKLHFEISKITSQASDFRFETPTAVAAIRGTSGGIGTSGASTFLYLTSGNIDFLPKGSGKPYKIETNQIVIQNKNGVEVKQLKNLEKILQESNRVSKEILPRKKDTETSPHKQKKPKEIDSTKAIKKDSSSKVDEFGNLELILDPHGENSFNQQFKIGSSRTVNAAPKTLSRNKWFEFVSWETDKPENIIFEDPIMHKTKITLLGSEAKVIAKYKTITYSLEVLPSLGGKIEGEPKREWEKGKEFRISARPASGFRFKNWEIIEGDPKVNDLHSPQLRITLHKNDVILKPLFSNKKYLLEMKSTVGGEVSDLENDSITPGKPLEINALPENGYFFKEWRLLNGDVFFKNQNKSHTIITIGEANSKIEASFKPLLSLKIFEKTESERMKSKEFKLQPNETTTISIENKISRNNKTYQFEKWEIIEGRLFLENPNKSTTEIKMGNKNVNLNAVYLGEKKTILIRFKDAQGRTRSLEMEYR